MTLRTMTVAMVSVVVFLTTGCGQKAEVIPFAEAGKAGMLEFKYSLTTGGTRGERDTDWARVVPAEHIPSTLAFTPAEKPRVVVDRHTEGTVVRIEIDHNGQHRCCECTVNADRVYSGTFLTRGRQGYSVDQAELLRTVAPRMVEMLRAEEPAK